MGAGADSGGGYYHYLVGAGASTSPSWVSLLSSSWAVVVNYRPLELGRIKANIRIAPVESRHN